MSHILESRSTSLAALDGKAVDLLVVGGGITGAGVAREAACRGLRTVLAEKRDFAFGTSSRSSKLIHGGLRYLEHGEFGLVFEATNERQALLHIAPHLVRPLPFLFPAFKNQKPGFWTMEAGMAIYDALSLFSAPRLHRPLGRARTLRIAPELRRKGLRGSICYSDARTDDSRLTLETILDAQRTGATCMNRLEVTQVTLRGGRVESAHLKCGVTGRSAMVLPRTVVLATGPWTDRVRTAIGLPSAGGPMVRGTRGAHLVVDGARLPKEHAVVLRSPADGRVMFMIPWDGRALIGTTDLDFVDDPGEVRATAAEVRYMLDAANHHFPRADLTEDDVISTYAGVRPLVHQHGGDPSDVSREHEIVDRGDGILTIVGGKLTTYRVMAEDIVDVVVKNIVDMGGRVDGRPLHAARNSILGKLRDRWSELADGTVLAARGTTARRLLPGAVGVAHPGGPDRVRDDAHRALGDAGAARHLLLRYGGRTYDILRLVAEDPSLGHRIASDLPIIWAEIPFAAMNDLALGIDDVMDRRTGLFLVDRNQGLDAVERVGDLLAPILGWDPETRAREIETYRESVRRSRQWRRDQNGSSGDSSPSPSTETSSIGTSSLES